MRNENMLLDFLKNNVDKLAEINYNLIELELKARKEMYSKPKITKKSLCEKWLKQIKNIIT